MSGDKTGRQQQSGGERPAARRYAIAGQVIEAPRLASGLHVVATPIGNLRDISLRALETLAAADIVACEDTRVTRKLFDHYALTSPMMSYHDHNAEIARPKILEMLAAGKSVALVSDAGNACAVRNRSAPGGGAGRSCRGAGRARSRHLP